MCLISLRLGEAICARVVFFSTKEKGSQSRIGKEGVKGEVVLLLGIKFDVDFPESTEGKRLLTFVLALLR